MNEFSGLVIISPSNASFAFVHFRLHPVPLPCPLWGQSTKTRSGWTTKYLSLFLKPWCTVYFTSLNPFLPDVPSQVAHTLSLAYTAYMWYLWWEKWGLKALKFLQLHLFKQFLIILPWNYKNSGTRANLTINCASSICKGIQIKCRCLSPKLDSRAPWTIQHPARTQFPTPQLKTLSRLGRQILGLSAVTSAPSLPFPVSYSFQGACPWAM